MSDKAKVVIVVAMSKNGRALGRSNELLWHIPEDLKRFKEKTLGHPIIMGRKTFESIIAILGKPLPGRTNIVVTRNKDFTYEGVIVASSLAEALTRGNELDKEEVHIGGGAEIYKQILPMVDTLYVTYVHDEPEADTFFPEFENDFEISKMHPMQKHEGLEYQWVDYKRT
jgi:dihydrofolate reductase